MVDFAKLNDPAHRALAAAIRKKEEAELEALEKKVNDAMLLCQKNDDALTSVESEFIRSLRRSMNLYFKPPSVKQQNWLFDIAARLVTPAERAAIEDRAKKDIASLRRSAELNDVDGCKDATCALKEGMRDSVIYATIVKADAEMLALIAVEQRPKLP